MPLQFKNIAVGNLQDDVSGNNYAANKAVYILNLNNTLAQIFSDETGTVPIVQDGVNNVTGAKGVFGFWVEAGDYFVQVGANKYRVSITGADYFNNRIDETIDIIVDSVAGRGAYYVIGSFEAGFTYTDINQVGTFGGTDYYIYTGGLSNLPHNVTAGTDPTLSSDYAQVFYGEINNVQGLRGELNDRAPELTVANAKSATLSEGQYITIIDRDLEFFLVTSTPTVAANELDVIALQGGLFAELQAGKETSLIAYGAKTDGSDSSLAIAASIARRNRIVLPEGTISHSGFKYYSYTKIIGQGRQYSTLKALSATSKIEPVNASVRSYDIEVSKCSIDAASLSNIALDMSSVSSSNLFNVVIFGAQQIGVDMQSTTNGGCVYNTFIDVTIQSCPIGMKTGPLGSNDLKFIGGRFNNCSDAGMEIENSNHVIITATQLELCGDAIRLIATTPAATVNTQITDCRFENNTRNWNIGADVIDTNISNPYEVTGGNNIDNGTRTNVKGASGSLSANVSYSAKQDPEGSFRYVRTANGGNQTPAHVVDDESGINSPVQYEARSTAASKDSRFFRAKFGSTPKWGISGPHGVMVDIPTANGMAGTITTTTNTSVTANNVAVNASSLIQITPTNATAAQDMSNKGVYVTLSADTSLSINTGDGSNFTAGGTFNYFFVN